MSITTPTPQKETSKATTETTALAKKPAERVVVTPLTVKKPLHPPVSTKIIASELLEALPREPVHPRLTSIVAKVHPVVVADRRNILSQQSEERISARTLRRIKRRLFLEVVNSDHLLRTESLHKSPRNSGRLEVTGKENRMGSG
jgi:hypothetical protein